MKSFFTLPSQDWIKTAKLDIPWQVLWFNIEHPIWQESGVFEREARVYGNSIGRWSSQRLCVNAGKCMPVFIIYRFSNKTCRKCKSKIWDNVQSRKLSIPTSCNTSLNSYYTSPLFNISSHTNPPSIFDAVPLFHPIPLVYGMVLYRTPPFSNSFLSLPTHTSIFQLPPALLYSHQSLQTSHLSSVSERTCLKQSEFFLGSKVSAFMQQRQHGT